MKTDLSGIDRLAKFIHAMPRTDSRPLMLTWMKIIEEDNRKGVLAGLDKDGNPMARVSYRPTSPKPAKVSKDQKNNTNRRSRGVFAGFGPNAAGLNNNLTSGEYRKLDGPPLAPRGAFSRVITNLVTRYSPDGPDARVAEGTWRDVVSTKGVPFLKAHFDGIRQKVRDLRGVRPEGVERARKAAKAWLLDQIRTYGKAA